MHSGFFLFNYPSPPSLSLQSTSTTTVSQPPPPLNRAPPPPDPAAANPPQPNPATTAPLPPDASKFFITRTGIRAKLNTWLWSSHWRLVTAVHFSLIVGHQVISDFVYSKI
ncbi:hypothetical protein HanRHA438_Chr10g0435501 [Helianthus annuus]|nr:hypothetical protein HanRHA438_Chr10g0435501 [Helianthus annuus]